MKASRVSLIIAFAAVFVLLIYLLYRFGGSNHVNWFIMYRQKEQQPYDVSVISKLLDDYFPEKQFSILSKPVDQVLPVDSVEKSSYVFIGSSLFFSDSDYAQIFKFVRSGNDAFIAADEIPFELLMNIFLMEEYHASWFSNVNDSSVQLNFTHPELSNSDGYPYDFIYDWKKELYNWNCFSESMLVDSAVDYVALGTLNRSYLNFVKVPYGEGAFYLHTNPIVFTNYFLKQAQGYEYAGKAFSHLSRSKIYWDEFSKVPQFSNNNIGSTETPLRYILSQTSLRWSWYVLLTMLVLFVIFKSKRDQRIVPVTEENINSSLEFIHTIGRLYHQQNDHRAIAMQKMKLFLGFIRNRYALQTKPLDNSFIEKLSQKSQVSRKNIGSILEEYKTIDNMEDITAAQLFSFHSAIESFYERCK